MRFEDEFLDRLTEAGKKHGGKAALVEKAVDAYLKGDNGLPLSNEELVAELKRRLG